MSAQHNWAKAANSETTLWLLATVIAAVAAVLTALNGDVVPAIFLGVMAAAFLFPAFRPRTSRER